MSSKILTVFYSYSGNTKHIAEMIQKETGSDIFEIETVQSYPAGYNAVVEQAKHEKAEDYRPPLKSNPQNIKDYDIIILGTPVWWYTMAPALKSFITNNDLSGKTIIPFCTHGGGGASSTFIDIEKLAPSATVKKGFQVYEQGSSSTAEDIKDWIKSIT